MRKKFFIIAIFLCVSLQAQEQKNNERLTIDKGSWYLGGSVSVGYVNSDQTVNALDRNNKSTSFSFIPKAGYAVKKNLIAGLGLGYGYSKNKNMYENPTTNEMDNTDGTSNSFTVSPFIRQYFPVGEKLAFYVQGEANYSKTNYKYIDSNSGKQLSDGQQYFVGVRPGITYFISQKLALETSIGSLGYSKAKSTSDDNTNKVDSFNFNLSTADLLFGLSYYF